MKKILNTEQIRQADAYTIANEPIASIDLMERAAANCFARLKTLFPSARNWRIFCGTGNNGGDGLAIAGMLLSQGFQTEVFVAGEPETGSVDFLTNYHRLADGCITHISGTDFPFSPPPHGCIYVDALFGSGLNRPAEGIYAHTINYINQYSGSVVSVDLPSGLDADTGLPAKGAVAVMASLTLSLELPKLCMMLPESGDYCGDVEVVSIGLDQSFINGQQSPYSYIEAIDIELLLPFRKKFDHKGSFGHAILFAGSFGRMGAAVLSARACIRSGAGLTSVACPGSGLNILQTALPEAMTCPDKDERCLKTLPELAPYNALGFGPACGTLPETSSLLKLIIQEYAKPMVIDADGLNILAENKTWLAYLPKGSVLTPHVREFERLAGPSDSPFQRLEKAREFSRRYSVYLVLKGAHTAICCPDGSVMFNSTGNPGMATGGSGDVLTGIILAFLAQGMHPKQAAAAGVFVHGMAGDKATKKMSETALMASDIIEFLPETFLELTTESR